MSRLTLAKKVHRYLRVDANLPGTAPTTTLAQTGILGEIVGFVDDAYLNIQKLHTDWSFRLLQGTFTTTAAQRTYTRANVQAQLSTFDEFLIPTGKGTRAFLVHLTATGVADQSPCYFIDYEEWRGHWDQGVRATGKPAFFTIRQDQTIEFDPTPDATYTVTIDYRRTPHVFSADADDTLWADDFDDVVLWEAIMLYGATRTVAGNMLGEAERKLAIELNRMRRRYRPELKFNPRMYWGR